MFYLLSNLPGDSINKSMTNNCVDLNLKIDPISLEMRNILKNGYQTEIALNRLNPILIKVLEKHNVHISYAESFYSEPNFVQTIHTDNLGGDYVKLNYIYGGKGSVMKWYKVNADSISVGEKFSPGMTSTSYIPWLPHQVECVQTATVSFPSIVQTGCPHNIVNSTEPRLCITLLLYDPIIGRLSMADACERLAKFII
jgi:hypothetical protein